MYSLVRTVQSNALPRVSSNLSAYAQAHAFGRSPAYRRLLATQPLLLTQRSSQLPSSPLSYESTQSFLRSPLIPAAIQGAALLRSRAFHASTIRHQQQPDDKVKPPQAEPAKDAEKQTEDASASAEAKSESTAEDHTKKHDEEGQEAKSDGEKGSEEGDKKGKKEEPPPPPPHGDKTPWQVFMETMQTEFKQSKEWNEGTKALAQGAQDFSESERVQALRKAYEGTTGAVSSTASRAVKSTATAVGKGAAWTWETPVMKGVRKGANVTGEALDKATKPIRETEAYKHVKDVIDDGSSSRYGGWVEKEERRKKRELQAKLEELKGGRPQVMEEDPNAGTNVTVHKDAAWKEAWRDFKDTNRFVQGVFSMKNTYNESENPLISTARSITDKFAGFFAENETAMVIKKLRTIDPAFQVEPFLRELREYILPEVLDAYVKGDIETLKLWLSEAQYSVYEALTKQYLQAGLKSDGRILDIRHVDILKARMLEPGEIPVFIITCRTQEVHVYRNAKTNQLAAGMEDKVQLVTYAIGITRVPEDVNNPETRGWRLIEMQKSGRDYI